MKFGKTNETNEPNETNETNESKGKLKGKFTELFKDKKKRILFLILAGVITAGCATGITIGAVQCSRDNGDDDSTSSEDSSVTEQDTYYTVTFDVDGGSAVSSATVLKGETISKPATNPTKTGYVFVGWYANKSYTTPFAFGVMKVTADTTIYARFIQVEAEAAKYTISYVVDGVAYETAETVNGAIYQMPIPEKAGAKFVGWWKSDYKDANKLTAKVEDGAEIGENITLYAVWESDAPNVSVGGNTIAWTAKGVNNQYSVKVTAPDGSVVASTTTSQSSYTFDFASAQEGDYIVEVTVNGNTTTTYVRNKLLATVGGFAYEGSVLVWKAVPNATSYLVSVECGDPAHAHVDEVKTENAYDFQNCAMKADGIKFTVKAVADGYVTSDAAEFVVVKNLDAAANLAYDEATATFTWDAVANATSYVVTVNGTDYTQTANSFDAKTFTGDIAIKVVPVAFGYNSPAAAELTVNKTTLATPTNIKLAGSMLTWDAVPEATGYIVTINNKEYNVTEASFDVLTADNIAADAKECSVTVKAINADASKNSVASNEVKVGFGVMSDSLVYEGGQVTWQPVINATKYEVQVNSGEIQEFAGDAEAAPIVFTEKGENLISVRCYNSANEPSEWVTTKVEVYEISFNYGLSPETKSPVYLANGDTLTLPADVATPGYTFKGWYNAAENGVKYENASFTFEGNDDITVFAQWEANTYKITYKYVDFETGDEKEDTIEVEYGKAYTIASPYSDENGMTFHGWYSEKNGQGIQYTDELGNSISNWGGLTDIVVYANVKEAFKYDLITTASGQEAYSISAGTNFTQFSEITVPVMYKGKPVAWIDSGAFANYVNLKKINIPDSIERIYLGLDGAYSGTGSAFAKCSNLEEINVYDASASIEGNYQKNYTSIDGALVRVYEDGAKELSFVPITKTGTYTIPAEVTDIAPYLFRSYSNFGKIIVPATVQRIGDNAFQGCYANDIIFEDAEGASELTVGEGIFKYEKSLVSFHIPARMGQVKSLTDMFFQIEELTSITVAEGNKYYSSKPADSTTTSRNMLFNADGTTLLYCPRGIDDVVEIPNGTKTIASEAFGRASDTGSVSQDANRAIKKVIIPASVTSIAASAFEDCIGLEAVEFKGDVGDGALNIGSKAFYGTTLQSLELPGNTGSVGQYAFGKINLTEVTIKSGDASFALANGAFATDTGAYTIETVKVAKCTPVFNIGAFGTKLKNVVFIDGVSDYMTVIDEVLYDKDVTQVLYYPDSRTSTTYDIPETIVTISSNAFSGKPFTEIVIPYSTTSIGDGAFKGCSSLTKVTFGAKPADAKENNGLAIGASVFENCSRLTTLVLPSYTKTIGASAFKNSGISGTFKIPEGVTTVGTAAFENCSKMQSIEIPTTLTTLELATDSKKTYYQLTMLNGCSSLESIVVAEGHETYMTKDGALYAHTNGVPNTLVYCPRQYKLDESLNGKFTVPYSVSTIYAYAFNGNSSIQELAFEDAPEGVTTSSLTIQKNAFAGTVNLKRVTLGYGLATITAEMFANCTSLEYLSIPTSVTEIKANAFKGCSSLTELDFKEGEGGELKIAGQSSSGGYQGGSVGLSGLTGLKVLRLPERVKTINNYAFANLTSLEELYIPLSVTTIGADIFNKTNGCKNLKKLEIADVGEGQDPTSTDYALTIGTYLFAYLPSDCEFNLPLRTKSIGAYAFKDKDITSITIPENVTSIGNYAFQNCTSLTEINFAGNSKLATIGNYAFANTAITSFVVPATVTSIGEYAFAYTKDCTSVTFAAGSALKEIKQYAFRQSGITELKIPESTDNIALGASLFQYCTDITKVELSKSVVSAAGTFMGCGSLKQVIIDPANANLSVQGSTVFNADKTAIQFLSAAAETDAEGVYRIADGVTSITNGAFKNQIDIKKLYIPATVTTIGLNAFEGCINLEEVIFENPEASACATISDYAFYNCHSLRKIELPNGVTKLGKYAFRYCYALSDLKIPGVTTLDQYALANCTSLATVELNDNMATINNYAFYGAGLTSIKLPSSFAIKSLTATGSTGSVGIFYNCAQLASVTIPEGIEKLGYNMFYGCTALQTIDVPATVKEFGQGVFRNSGLTSFEFKHENPALATYTFAGCTELRTVILPSKMSVIKGYTFNGCSSLVSTSADETAGVIIPNTVTSVANYAFQNCTSLKKIKFSDEMTFLGAGTTWSSTASSYVLDGCTSLEEVTLSTKMKQIGQYAFSNCPNLTTVNNTETLTTLGDNVFRNSGIVEILLPKVTSLGTYVFSGAERLESITLDNMTKVPKYTFQDAKLLASFDFSKISTIEEGAFKGAGLTEVNLPKITSIGKEVFMDCENLTKVECPKVKTIGESAFANCVSLTDFAMPDVLTTIGAQAFMGTALTEVILPATVTSIAKNAFAFCYGITSFAINTLNKTFVVEDNAIMRTSGQFVCALPGYQVTDGILYITAENDIKAPGGHSPFAGNTTITEVVVTANWTSVPSYFFADMLALKKVTLPETVTSIGSYAFAGATALEEVKMPGVKTISSYAFDGASALITVDMANVTSVQSYAFAGCVALDVEVPETITSIGTYAFAESGLKSVNIPAHITNIPEGAFYGTKRLASVTLHEGLETIEIYAFAESGVESITIPASVTKFGTNKTHTEPGTSNASSRTFSYAFANCTSLKTVVFLGENPNLTGHTFEGCTALESVTLPSKMTFVEDYMFYGCTSLKNITLPETVTEIGGYAFAYAGLTSITLPASLTIIGTPNDLKDTSNVADVNNLYQTGATQKNPVLLNPNGHTFTGCANLETVTFLGNVTYIGWYSFEGCTKLKNITIPNTVEIIGDYAFANCESLGDFVVPESVLFIGNYAFANSKATSITIVGDAVVYNNAFEGWTAEQTIKTSKSAFQAASLWNLGWYNNSKATIVWEYVAE